MFILEIHANLNISIVIFVTNYALPNGYIYRMLLHVYYN